MSIADVRYIRPALAVLLSAAAAVAALRAWDRIGFYQRQIEARAGELEELDRLNGRMAEIRKGFESLAHGPLTVRRLGDMIRDELPGVEADVMLRETTPAAFGWKLHRYDVRLESIASARLSSLLTAMENATPKIRVTELLVSAEEQGIVTAQLAVTELEPPGDDAGQGTTETR